MSARRPPPRRAVQTCVSCESDKVVANRDPIARSVGDFDDRPAVGPALVLFTQIDLGTRRCNRTTIGIYSNSYQRPLELLAVRVRGGDDAHLEGIEDHAGTHRINSNQV